MGVRIGAGGGDALVRGVDVVNDQNREDRGAGVRSRFTRPR